MRVGELLEALSGVDPNLEIGAVRKALVFAPVCAVIPRTHGKEFPNQVDRFPMEGGRRVVELQFYSSSEVADRRAEEKS